MYIEISYKFIYIVVAINNNGNIVKYFLNPSKLNIFSIEIVINDKFKKNRISFKHLIKKSTYMGSICKISNLY